MKPALLATAALLFTACSPAADTQKAADAPPIATAEHVDLTRADELATGTLAAIADAIAAGEVSSEDMVQAYLKRIEEIDRSGPTLRSVLSLNPNALEDAINADKARQAGEELGPLHGVPILLKDLSLIHI